MTNDTSLPASAAENGRGSETLDGFFDNAPIGLLWIDSEGTILRANRAELEFLGHPLEECVGHSLGDFHSDPEEIESLLARLLQGETVHDHEAHIRGKDGSVKQVLIDANVLRDGEQFVHACCFVRDITQRKRAESEDQERFRMAIEAGRKQAEEDLEEGSRRKDEFLAMLAHELRNPLAPIQTCLDILQQPGVLPSEVESARATIGRQVRHLTGLVDQFLDVSRVSEGKILLVREPLDLVDVVRVTFGDGRRSLETAGLTVELETPAGPLWMIGDRNRLSQMLGNLLSNACKFTDAGGRVSVGLQPEPDGRGAVITVRDTGVGIEPAVLAHIFDPFVQADRTLERARGGLGLGLALARRLVELHGGTIRASSEGEGRGAEFAVRLPLESEPQDRTSETAAAPAGPGRRVLVIEDNRDAAESMKLLLELLGHRVAVAHDGARGIELARTFLPEAVLCDIGLPGGMDGYAVARSMRADPALESVCLIALTGYGLEEDHRRTREAGFDAHLTKPADLAELKRILADMPGEPRVADR